MRDCSEISSVGQPPRRWASLLILNQTVERYTQRQIGRTRICRRSIAAAEGHDDLEYVPEQQSHGGEQLQRRADVLIGAIVQHHP